MGGGRRKRISMSGEKMDGGRVVLIDLLGSLDFGALLSPF